VIVTFKVGKNMKEAINRLSSQLSPEK
jgi:hypothetical protein